ncbi:protein prenylyltransferase [Xylariomycetidae sp. FL2044]|nr:protein prenylyltransferase [Xylariomycetidae sp. FL2044]
MDNHGRARVTRVARTEEHRRQDLDKIAKYRDLETSIRESDDNNNNDQSQSLFQLTSKLLRLNPEYYTIWNVRRRCLISGLLSKPSPGSWPSKASPSTSPNVITIPSSEDSSPPSSAAIPRYPEPPTTGKNGTIPSASPASKDKDQQKDAQILQSELAFTVPLLLEYPKCYWLWKHRRWALDEAILRLPLPVARNIWEAELALDSQMLTKDKRNFHAWGYRRHVVAKLEELRGKSMAEEEFAYTTTKIRSDLSNFSAWHNRSQLISRVLNDRDADDPARAAFLDEELELVREGLNVGPEDQSLWYYHHFLISQIINDGRSTIVPALTTYEKITYVEREIEEIKDLLEDYEDVKWLYEVLIEYSLVLRQLKGSLDDDGDDQDDLKGWFKSLRELDPMRTGRWNDLERQVIR